MQDWGISFIHGLETWNLYGLKQNSQFHPGKWEKGWRNSNRKSCSIFYYIPPNNKKNAIQKKKKRKKTFCNEHLGCIFKLRKKSTELLAVYPKITIIAVDRWEDTADMLLVLSHWMNLAGYKNYVTGKTRSAEDLFWVTSHLQCSWFWRGGGIGEYNNMLNLMMTLNIFMAN